MEHSSILTRPNVDTLEVYEEKNLSIYLLFFLASLRSELPTYEKRYYIFPSKIFPPKTTYANEKITTTTTLSWAYFFFFFLPFSFFGGLFVCSKNKNTLEQFTYIHTQNKHRQKFPQEMLCVI